MSLYTFGNEVIRPFTRRIGEPSVHFALNRIDAATRTAWLSEILNFYPEDFVPDHAPNLQTPRQLPSAMNATNAYTADRVPPSPAALRPSPTGALCRRVRAWNGTCWRRHPGGDRAGARCHCRVVSRRQLRQAAHQAPKRSPWAARPFPDGVPPPAPIRPAQARRSVVHPGACPSRAEPTRLSPCAPHPATR